MLEQALLELALLFALCVAVAVTFHRLRLPPIVGFLVAGVLVGPNAIGLVHHEEMVRQLAEVGIVVLLFAVGLEVPLGQIARLRRTILLGGGVQVVGTVLAAAGVAWALGMPWPAAVFLGFLLSLAIVTGGQYLLQGVSEEKESRILESLVCTVSPDELMLGKLIGLGGAGLTLVGIWIVVGLATVASSFAFLDLQLPASLGVLGFVYFLLGYLFYASLMTGIGGITNNLREAQQFAVAFTMMNFVPFYLLVKILNAPNSGVAIGMSLFPPTAATTMMMRLSAGAMTGAEIPFWQIALSLALLAGSGALALLLAARVFRLGMLMYGKTPTLPEILKLMRQG